MFLKIVDSLLAYFSDEMNACVLMIFFSHQHVRCASRESPTLKQHYRMRSQRTRPVNTYQTDMCRPQHAPREGTRTCNSDRRGRRCILHMRGFDVDILNIQPIDSNNLCSHLGLACSPRLPIFAMRNAVAERLCQMYNPRYNIKHACIHPSRRER